MHDLHYITLNTTDKMGFIMIYGVRKLESLGYNSMKITQLHNQSF